MKGPRMGTEGLRLVHQLRERIEQLEQQVAELTEQLGRPHQ